MTTGTFTITLGNDIGYLGNTRLKAINLQPGVTLVIEGDGHTLNGGGVQRGLSGSVAADQCRARRCQ